MSFKQFSSTQDAQTNDKPDGKAKAAPVTAQPAQKPAKTTEVATPAAQKP